MAKRKKRAAHKRNWVDYQEVKARVSMEMILRHYGIFETLKKSGGNLVGCCPIHGGSNPRQFSVSLERNIYNCFGDCKSGGNVLDFTAKIEGIPLREAALLLQDRFPGASEAEMPEEPGEDKREEKTGKQPGEPGDSPADVSGVNPPLKFRLKSLEAEHGFFDEREIRPDTVKHFGLGYCRRGIMAGRIVIPIHNEAGELVAYCGRAVNTEQIEREGKYKLPAGFVKTEIVFNLHRQRPGAGELVLVESYLSVFRLYQCGLPLAAALMGSVMSEKQEKLIADHLGPHGRAILMFDADDDGQLCAEDCLKRLSPRLFVKTADISCLARKPHQLTPAQIKLLI